MWIREIGRVIPSQVRYGLAFDSNSSTYNKTVQSDMSFLMSSVNEPTFHLFGGGYVQRGLDDRINSYLYRGFGGITKWLYFFINRVKYINNTRYKPIARQGTPLR